MNKLLALHNKYPERYPFLLESVVHGTEQAQYDILFAFPGKKISSSNNSKKFLQVLDHQWKKERVDTENSNLPFSGGWFLLLGYELAAEIEHVLTLPKSDMPKGVAVRIPAAIIYEHSKQKVSYVAEPAYVDKIPQMQEDLNSIKSDIKFTPEIFKDLEIIEDPEDDFLTGVEKIRDYIKAGDIFQVNLSRGWECNIATANSDDNLIATQLYTSLCKHNPAPFAGIARVDDYVVISSSPERLVSVKGGVVTTRPIAGTRPRNNLTAQADQQLQDELITNVKERAEHIMLVDLERNDLGRVAKFGTVKVDEMMGIESYAHVHHIVSNVSGELKEDITPGQIIAATFPGGTITGCPKVRCMEIIAELEQHPRDFYTGSMGYLNHNGDMDLNILIRTFVQKANKLSFRAGAGIVYDSIPDKELAETRCKARGLLNAITA